MFPLIPLPVKEATSGAICCDVPALKFPLIPLPVKEATPLL
jgi:hypothetical protein